MPRRSLISALFSAVSLFFIGPASAQSWQPRLEAELPLMGHRNWILVVDSAYPEQVGAGIETIETNADQVEVVRSVLAAVQKSIHVRPSVFMDAELPFVPDKDAPGVSNYRTQIKSALGEYEVQSRLHQSLIDEVAKDGALYRVLILKTRLAVPYTSVFIHLDCKYWSNDNERALRDAMNAQGTR